MKDVVLSPPMLGFVVVTRAMLAFGAGLLVSNRIPEARRRPLALTLIAIGAATTLPAAKFVLGNRASSPELPGV
jgi:hypothetical protein